jgi:nitric oxide reductase activation protein
MSAGRVSLNDSIPQGWLTNDVQARVHWNDNQVLVVNLTAVLNALPMNLRTELNNYIQANPFRTRVRLLLDALGRLGAVGA